MIPRCCFPLPRYPALTQVARFEATGRARCLFLETRQFDRLIGLIRTDSRSVYAEATCLHGRTVVGVAPGLTSWFSAGIRGPGIRRS